MVAWPLALPGSAASAVALLKKAVSATPMPVWSLATSSSICCSASLRTPARLASDWLARTLSARKPSHARVIASTRTPLPDPPREEAATGNSLIAMVRRTKPTLSRLATFSLTVASAL